MALLRDDPVFLQTAIEFGQILARENIRLIYGGGGVGLMGAVARACAEAGGRVTGIIPDFLIGKEQAFDHAHELVVTQDMHERKRLMFERADAFVALPAASARWRSWWNNSPGFSSTGIPSR